MGYMGSYYDMPKAIFYLLKGDYIIRTAVFWVCTGLLLFMETTIFTIKYSPSQALSRRPANLA